ncbi:MAG: dTDP-4-amino-4,6-dideoxygalactose transaminase [Christensenellaceae bacterium]
MIDFNVPPYVSSALEYIKTACVTNKKICGDGPYTKKVSQWLEQQTQAKKVLLTTSCSHGLDMMILLAGIGEGDEVILPSYNFVSAANSIAMRGATCVFVDIRKDTMNIDEKLIEQAITKKTKAIFPMHYAGVACEMNSILEIAKKYNLLVLEDAAQGMMSAYHNKPLGTIGLFGSYSFHETKNYSMGEGGCLLINDETYIERAEILREKGTDRSKFWRGEVDKYTWQDVGSSYLPSDMNAAYLWSQLEIAQEINEDRLHTYHEYEKALQPLAQQGLIELPHIPKECTHNGHMFYIKCKDLKDRTAFIEYMKENGTWCVFHYIPLHSAPAGKKFGRFAGEDVYTTKESERLVRLPLYYGMKKSDIEHTIQCVFDYYKK